ncbi:MAG: putative porin [Candidatus Omnitrophica bacterium]|nr:putative porin [Candidatus Omnitrophota bacterium]
MRFPKLLIVVIASVLTVVSVQAGEIDILLEKLVQKGIFTHQEAAQIRTEVEQEMRAGTVKTINETLPNLLTNTKFGGDLRLRYQWEQTETPTTKEDRQRGRFRLRYGFQTEVNETLKAGLRLATGGKEPTSTNQTFERAFVGKTIAIDQAYVTYRPAPFLALTGGKMPNPYFCTDLLWDSDINPEGVAATLQFNENKLRPFATFAFYGMGENKNWSADPAILAAQTGVNLDLAGRPLNLALTYYNFMGLKGKFMQDVSPDYVKRTNSNAAVVFPATPTSLQTTKHYWIHDYELLDVNCSFTPFVFNETKPLTIYGNYLQNLASGVKDKIGWLAGFSLGKAKEKGEWEINYNYRRLEKDAAPDIIVDSDFHGGGTNCHGHKISFGYSLQKNVSLNLTYFNTGVLTGTKRDVQMLQADLNVKF